MKKLLYIANLRLPTEKAYGIQIAKMCEAFASQGVDVTLSYPFRGNHITSDIFSYYSVKDSFKIKKIWTPDFYFPGRFDKFAVNIKSIMSALVISLYAITQKVNIIYSRDEWPLYFLSFFKKNLFFEAHRFSKSRMLFYKRFKNKNLKVIVITEHLKDDFVKIGFKPENILVAPDGVDLAEFDINVSKEEARTQVGLPLDKKIVMYTGHLFEWKGANVLLEVARNFQNNEKDILFVFVGGMDYDITKFKEKAKGLKNILILGHKSHKDIPFFLKAADVLVLPNSAKKDISKYYTSPLKLFEYMASKRPIVASGTSSVREVLNENNALLTEPDNGQQLTEAIEKIISNNVMSNQLVQKAFEDVKNYTWEKRVGAILNFSR